MERRDPTRAAAATPTAQATAKRVIGLARQMGMPPDGVKESNRQGLHLQWGHPDRYVIYECDKDGDVVALHQDRQAGFGKVYAVARDAVESDLRAVAEFLGVSLGGEP